MRAELFADASRLVHPVIGRHGYAIAYGSHARGVSTARSDFDLLVVGPRHAGQAALDALIDGVKRLHHRHGLDLDEEVSYEVKLYACFADVAAAMGFEGFVVNGIGDLSVPPVVASSDFLNGRRFQLRLLLNALTSPYVFLGGAPDRVITDQARACRTLALVSLSILTRNDVVTVPQAIDALVTDPNSGATGEDYLGYTGTDTPLLCGRVHLGFAYLERVGVVQPIDGARFRQCHPVRRSLVLAGTSRLRRAPLGTPRRLSGRLGRLPVAS